jgi:hypothetical protein
MWSKKCQSNTSVGGKQPNERVFIKTLQHRERTVLLLDAMPIEDYKTQFIEQVLHELGAVAVA